LATPQRRQDQTPSQPMPEKPVLAEVATYYPGVTDRAAAAVIHLEPGEVRTAEIKLRTVATVSIRGMIVPPHLKDEKTFVSLVARNDSSRSDLSGSEISADGSFVIAGVPSGSYYLVAKRLLFPGGSEGGSAQPNGNYAVSISLDSIVTKAIAGRLLNVHDKNLDGVTLQMGPLFDVRGIVTIEGNARCSLTTGIDTVTSLYLEPEGPYYTAWRPTRINAGSFSIPNVAHLPHRVQVSYFGPCYMKSIRYGNREDAGGVLDFAGDGPLEVVFAMAEKLEGTVVDREGKPFTRATVVFVPQSGDISDIQSVSTGMDGSFASRGLRPGSYRIFAWEDSSKRAPVEFIVIGNGQL
jgi:hypothetical protein